jgi:hypothetical protein
LQGSIAISDGSHLALTASQLSQYQNALSCVIEDTPQAEAALNVIANHLATSNNGNSFGNLIGIDANGESYYENWNNGHHVERHNSDGTLDATYGSGGSIALSSDYYYDWANHQDTSIKGVNQNGTLLVDQIHTTYNGSTNTYNYSHNVVDYDTHGTQTQIASLNDYSLQSQNSYTSYGGWDSNGPWTLYTSVTQNFGSQNTVISIDADGGALVGNHHVDNGSTYHAHWSDLGYWWANWGWNDNSYNNDSNQLQHFTNTGANDWNVQLPGNVQHGYSDGTNGVFIDFGWNSLYHYNSTGSNDFNLYSVNYNGNVNNIIVDNALGNAHGYFVDSGSNHVLQHYNLDGSLDNAFNNGQGNLNVQDSSNTWTIDNADGLIYRTNNQGAYEVYDEITGQAVVHGPVVDVTDSAWNIFGNYSWQIQQLSNNHQLGVVNINDNIGNINNLVQTVKFASKIMTIIVFGIILIKVWIMYWEWQYNLI